MILKKAAVQNHRKLLVEEIFSNALDNPPADRAKFLDRACGGDAALRAEVEGLLAANDTAGAFMDAPICESRWVGLDRPVARSVIESGRRIGSYEIVRHIATGGMGGVYEAIQDQPHRTVALKIMRAGVATDAELRRFQYESEILGRLRHPGIAQIYEAGVHDDGLRSVPYFAMEYLPEAQDIVTFAQRRNLSVRRRLELLARVCDAVQYGHQKGVIHRDLKPANILVTESDSDPTGTPRVIDFGVAVATDIDIQTTMRSDLRELVGTLQYMSPEQLRGDPAEIDSRTDVYSLGVILYELLAERRPYDLARKSLAEAVAAIDAQSYAALGAVSKKLRGDLETIVATAMTLEKSRRYQSPGELAADIRRYLTDQPISARPAGRLYQLRKFAARNQALVAGALISLASILMGAGVAVWQAVQATEERNRAVASAQRAEQISAFLQSILREADPRTSNAGITLRESIDQAMASFDASQIKDPRAFAEIEKVIGSIYTRLGRNDEARKHLTLSLDAYRALAGNQPDLILANALSDLAWVAGDNDEEGWRRSLALFNEALEIKRNILGDRDAAVANLMVASAMCRRELGEIDDAVLQLETAMAILRAERGEDNDDYAFAMMALGGCMMKKSDDVAAERLYRGALEKRLRLFPPDHIDVAMTMESLARSLRRLGRDEEAATMEARTAEIKRRRYGSRVDVGEDRPKGPGYMP